MADQISKMARNFTTVAQNGPSDLAHVADQIRSPGHESDPLACPDFAHFADQIRAPATDLGHLALAGQSS